MVIRELLTRFGADSSGFTKGAGEVKAQLTALNKDFYANQKAMKSVNDELKALEKEQKEFDKLIKDGVISKQSKEYQENAQKIDALNLKKAQLKTNEQQIKAEISKTTTEMKEQSNAADKNRISMQQFGDVLKKVATGYFAAGTALFAFTSKMGANADDINTAAKKYGIATDEIQKFAYASDLIDVEADTVYGAMSKMVKNMATAQKGTGDAAEAFKALGIEIESNGQLLDKMDVWEKTIAALGRMENETQRDAYAMQIFGKSAMELNPLILGGADALKQLGDEAERNGLILSQEKLDKLNAYNDKIDTFKAKLQQSAMIAGSEAVDAFNDLFDSTDEVVEIVKDLIVGTSKLIGFTIQHKDIILALVSAYGTFKVAMSIGTLISGVVGAVRSLSAANQAATATQLTLNAAVKANPYVLLASVLASVIGAIAGFALVNKESAENTYIATDALEEETAKLSDMVSQYEELGKKTNKTWEEKVQLSEIQNELIDSYGVESGKIDLVNGKYDEQLKKLDDIKKAKLEELQNQQIVNTNVAKRAYNNNTNNDIFTYVKGASRQADFKVAKEAFTTNDMFSTGYDQNGYWSVGFKEEANALERYNALSSAIDTLKEKGQTNTKTFEEMTKIQSHYKEECIKLTEVLGKEVKTSEELGDSNNRLKQNKALLSALQAEFGNSTEKANEETKKENLSLAELNKILESNKVITENAEVSKTVKVALETAERLKMYGKEVASIKSVADANIVLMQMEEERWKAAISINSYYDQQEYEKQYGAGTDFSKLKAQVNQIKSIMASMSKSSSTSASKTQSIAKQEISALELATNAYKKLTDSKIAAIDKEIAAKQKLQETNEKQKEIDRINYELKNANGSQLDEFSRLELTKKRDTLVQQQKDAAWLDSMNAKKLQLQEAQTYASNIFSAAKGSTPSAQSIVNNNSSQANINLVAQGATAGQIAKAIYDKLMKGLAI